MTLRELLLLAPMLWPVAGALAIVVVLTAGLRGLALAAGLAAAGLVAGLTSLAFVAAGVPTEVTPLLVIDRFGLFYLGLILVTALAVVGLALPYLTRRSGHREEFFVLVLIATVGAQVLVVSRHLVALFLGIETLSVALYALIAFPGPARSVSGSESEGVDRGRRGVEAAFKYLVLASAASAFLLFGMALLYAVTGALELPAFGAALGALPDDGRTAVYGGLLLVGVGFGFKLAWVPFHLWTPDVYEAAPAPATAFIATVSKGAVFAALLRAHGAFAAAGQGSLAPVLTGVAVLSMVSGNLLALRQDDLKRMLAYSSIAHLGYLLVAFLAGGASGQAAAALYLVAYTLTTLAAFGVVGAVSGSGEETRSIERYTGLFWRRPATALVLAVALLSLAGIPLTGGFVAKFLLVAAGVESSLWVLVAVLVASSAVGLYYYFRYLIALFLRPVEEVAAGPPPGRLTLEGVLLALLLVLLVGLGLWPGPLLELIGASAAMG